jgi:hypothetical protein
MMRVGVDSPGLRVRALVLRLAEDPWEEPTAAERRGIVLVIPCQGLFRDFFRERTRNPRAC